MVDQQIAVDPGSKRDQGRHHLHAGAHGVDQVSPRIQPDIGLKDIISHNDKPLMPDTGPDIGAEERCAGGRDNPGGIRVIADTHLHDSPVAGGDVLPDTPFNMFMVAHYPEIR